MRCLVQVVILLFIIANVVKSQRTDEFGSLLKINYRQTGFDTSSVGNWTNSTGTYEGQNFSSYSAYYKVYNNDGNLYGLSSYHDWGILAGFGLKLENFKNSNSLHYYKIMGEIDLISPFTITNSNAVFRENGVLLLNGDIHQCFLEFSDEGFIKHQLTFSNLEDRSIILGEVDNLLLVISSEQSINDFHLCSIDSSFTVTSEKSIQIEIPTIHNEKIIPNYIYKFKDSYYVGNSNYGTTLVYNYENDSLKINSVFESDAVYGYRNSIYYWKEQKVVKSSFDSLINLFNKEKILIDDLPWGQYNFPESGSGFVFCKNDSVYVLDLVGEEIIFQMYLEEGKYLSNTPLIDSSYIYLHKIDKITNVEKNVIIPENYLLSPNYPNPFNPTTTIEYGIPYSDPSTGRAGVRSQESEVVTLKVYDILGREVATLVNKQQQPGIYKVEFDASNLASGVYYYQLKVDNYIKTMKMIILK